MTRLSVNLNKIAWLRNSREGATPEVLYFAQQSIKFGAQGITVHPRPDGRHIRRADVYALAESVSVEFNIEGNPTPEFIDLVNDVKPAQVTLVPDDPNQLTSDHGWDLAREGERLKPIIDGFKSNDIRVSLFMDPVASTIPEAAVLGADRVELYTESYAQAWEGSHQEEVLQTFVDAALQAEAQGLGVNAGHDLNQENLGVFCRQVPNVLEVSIGHALVSEALVHGWESTVRAYVDVLKATTT